MKYFHNSAVLSRGLKPSRALALGGLRPEFEEVDEFRKSRKLPKQSSVSMFCGWDEE
jgi:hypothetical protein